MAFVGGGMVGGYLLGGECCLGGAFVCHDRADCGQVDLGALNRKLRSM